MMLLPTLGVCGARTLPLLLRMPGFPAGTTSPPLLELEDELDELEELDELDELLELDVLLELLLLLLLELEVDELDELLLLLELLLELLEDPPLELDELLELEAVLGLPTTGPVPVARPSGPERTVQQARSQHE